MAALSLWRLRPGTERRWFLFLLAFVFICIAVTGVARSQFGPITSASSRYQYQPGAGLAVLMVLAWQPLVRALDSRRRRLGMALSALALFYLLGAHVYRIRWQNESANRGLEAQAFLRVGRASVTAEGAGSGRPLGPDVPLPYAAFAPGTFPLWAALQVLEGTRERILPVGDFLGSKDGEWEGNELRGGGFETDSAVAFWKVFGEATVRRSQGAALHGTAGAQVGLRGLASAVSRDVVTRCPEELEGRAYSFRLSVRTTDAKLVSRMVFKARDGKILGIFSSPGHAGDGAWHPLVTGGLAPKGACVVGVDLTSSAPTPTTAQVDDALFLSHPASVDGAGRLLPAPR